MSVNNQDSAMEAIKDSLAAALPHRYVQRSLVDPANVPAEKLRAGLLCVVSEGGGDFANYMGREADLGRMQVRLVGFVLVEESAEPVEVERAELALLGEVLLWLNTTKVPGTDTLYPGDWSQSKQLEHPYGWLVLALDVKN